MDTGAYAPSPSQELSRARPMGFSDAFGPELDKFISLSQNLFVTGMARNNFISSRYHMLESYLTSGRGIRFLLIDPDSAALLVGAYARQRIADGWLVAWIPSETADAVATVGTALAGA